MIKTTKYNYSQPHTSRYLLQNTSTSKKHKSQNIKSPQQVQFIFDKMDRSRKGKRKGSRVSKASGGPQLKLPCIASKSLEKDEQKEQIDWSKL